MIVVYLQKQGVRDDVIYVYKDNVGGFLLKYVERNTSVRQSVSLSRTGVIDYFYNLFDILRIDDDPYHAIQINFPVYPAVLMDVHRITERRVRDVMHVLKTALSVSNSTSLSCLL